MASGWTPPWLPPPPYPYVTVRPSSVPLPVQPGHGRPPTPAPIPSERPRYGLLPTPPQAPGRLVSIAAGLPILLGQPRPYGNEGITVPRAYGLNSARETLFRPLEAQSPPASSRRLAPWLSRSVRALSPLPVEYMRFPRGSPPFHSPPGNWSPPSFEPVFVYNYSDSDNDSFPGSAFSSPDFDGQQQSRLKGGYDCQFVEPMSSDLQTECSVCLGILCEPYLVDCCGYRFCRSCIETVQDDSKSCPLCNKRFKIFPDKQLQRVLSQKQVYCKHKEDGCEWSGQLSELDKHLNDIDEGQGKIHFEGCPYVTLKCSNCEKLVKRADFESHRIRCFDCEYTCEYCNSFTSTYRDVADNHWPKCKSHPVPCPNECGKSPKRSELEMHVACECEQTIIQCDFANSGCEVKLPRIEMAAHMEAGALDHIFLLSSKNTALMKANHESASEIDLLMKECADLAFEVHNLYEDNTNLSEQNCLLQEEVVDKEDEIAQLLKMNWLLQEEVADKEDEVVALRKKLVQAESKLCQWQEQKLNPPATLCVENLPSDVNEQKLRSLFGQFGRVQSVIAKSSSVAWIVFEQPQAVARAMARSKDAQGLKLHKQRLKLHVINN